MRRHLAAGLEVTAWCAYVGGWVAGAAAALTLIAVADRLRPTPPRRTR